ncbi:MAG: pyridoxal phosphate-dependent aminotransferase [Phycisphaerales bacterium]|nr:pyridoxal phosphate-dependent aminotransferase [Phycisphaerales bacterium]
MAGTSQDHVHSTLTPPLADRVRNIRQTALRRLSARCQEIGGINLSQGVCDLPAPPEVKRAAQQAIDDDYAIYTHLAGIAPLREAIAAKMQAFNGITCDPQREIAVTVGSAGAFACIALALLNPGDEIITFSPYYTYYIDALKLLDVRVRFVNTHPPDWHYASDELAAAFTDRTRMVLINTPVNPTGKVFTRAELTEIAGLARDRGCWILTDEIYEYITFDVPHVSIGSLPEAAGRTITLSGPSKTYAVTGWRVGYAVGPAEVIEKALVASDLLTICAPAPLQHGVLAGMKLPDSYYDGIRTDYQAKRDLLADTLTGIGFEVYQPKGSFYLMADFGAGRFPNAMAAAESILEQVGVATVPGAPFYANPAEGESQLRFCFAKSMADLEEACKRLKKLPK